MAYILGGKHANNLIQNSVVSPFVYIYIERERPLQGCTARQDLDIILSMRKYNNNKTLIMYVLMYIIISAYVTKVNFNGFKHRKIIAMLYSYMCVIIISLLFCMTIIIIHLYVRLYVFANNDYYAKSTML